MLRAAISIPSNIAEGTSRSTDKAFSNFLEISLGSIYEVETQIELAYHFNYITKEDLDTFNNKIEILRRELISLIKKIK
ncbi:MAG: four helix bundle protein [Paludibacteraceae bacterium]|nr:four helix bundle protein [Paludibacteraceae bacterium]